MSISFKIYFYLGHYLEAQYKELSEKKKIKKSLVKTECWRIQTLFGQVFDYSNSLSVQYWRGYENSMVTRAAVGYEGSVVTKNGYRFLGLAILYLQTGLMGYEGSLVMRVRLLRRRLRILVYCSIPYKRLSGSVIMIMKVR